MVQGWGPVLGLLQALANQPNDKSCPLLGADLPVPHNLASSEIIKAATSKVPEILKTPQYGPIKLNETAFSVSLFSAKDGLLWEQHNTPDIPITVNGSDKVDKDSIYRVGSVSKLLTAYALLDVAGDEALGQPITKYIPELEAAKPAEDADEITSFKWEDITLEMLAGHLAGMVNEVSFGDLSAMKLPIVESGFPKLNDSQIPKCGAALDQKPCSREEFFKLLLSQSPLAPTSYTPEYSNTAFQLLGYAIEKIADKPIRNVIADFFSKIGMKSTSFSIPAADKQSKGVLLGGEAVKTFWGIDIGDESPAGGYYSTTSDLISAGRSILNHQLLSPAVTRKWMKPHTHTHNLGYSLGAPWEIIRTTSTNGRITDLYTKSGDLGAYSAYLVLSPDHDIGFTVIATAKDAHGSAETLVNTLVSHVLPAVEQAAKEEAKGRMAGTYSMKETNSTLKVSIDERPGMGVEFKAAGISLFEELTKLERPLAEGQKLGLRIYPTGLKTWKPTKDGKSKYTARESYRLVMDRLPEKKIRGDWAGFCFSWFSVGRRFYGGKALDEFVFNLSEEGKVEGVEWRPMGLKMKKV